MFRVYLPILNYSKITLIFTELFFRGIVLVIYSRYKG
nr:MAG TPA: hypothetical protein [Caudoviricetes sp.]